MPKPTLHLPDDDERIKTGGAPDSFGSMDDQDDDSDAKAYGATDAEMEAFENQIDGLSTQTVLPEAPKKAGWHRCWMTSNSSYDKIQTRVNRGYRPVKQADAPGFDPANGQLLAGYDGYIHCNEMVLFEIEEWKYQIMMKVAHHKSPMEQEEGVMSQMKEKKEGQQAIMSEGQSAMEAALAAAKKKVPHFD